MTLAYLGSVSIGATIPGVEAALAVGLTDLEARISALLAFSPAQIDFSAQLTVALQIVESIQASIALGLTPPSLAVQIALVAALLGALEAQLQIVLALKNLMATAGIDAYSYDGAVNGLGAALTSALAAGLPSGGTGATHCNALVLITSVAATWTAMGGVFIT